MIPLATTVPLSFGYGVVYQQAPARRPMMEVEFAGVTPEGILLGVDRTVVLVDSGADSSVLDAAFATRLGLDISSMPGVTITGVTGNLTVYSTTILASLCGKWIALPVFFDASGSGNNLLGREGAFDAMNLAFVHEHSVMLAAAV